MSLEDRKQWAEARRTLPSGSAEGATAPLRSTLRGELIVEALLGSKMTTLANEGSYFVATNPTVGTGVAGITASDGFDALESFIFLRNTESSATGKRIFLDYIRLQPTAAGTNGTNFSFAMVMDKGNSRIGTGGSAIVPVNANMDSVAGTVAQLQVGAVATAAASGDVRLINSGLLRTTIKVVGDQFLFQFGSSVHTFGGVQAATIANFAIPCPPVVLGPGQMFLLHEFAASQTVAAAYTFQMGWWER